MKSIREIKEGVVLGLWELNTSVAELAAQAPEVLLFHPEYLQLRSSKRQLEWLASRLLVLELLQQLTPEPHPINKDQFGKPVFSDKRFHLSLSHSGSFVAAIVAKDQEVGIDIELVSPKAKALAKKFLSETELQDAADSEVKTAVYWSAKETLYKVYGKKKLLFIENIPIKPFTLEQKGVLVGRVQVNSYSREFCVCYEQPAGYVLTYCAAEPVPEPT